MEYRIENFEALATNDLRRDALSIAEAGYTAINIGDALKRKLFIKQEELRVDGKSYNLAGRNVFFVGIGKCAFVAAEAIEKLLC